MSNPFEIDFVMLAERELRDLYESTVGATVPLEYTDTIEAAAKANPSGNFEWREESPGNWWIYIGGRKFRDK